MYDKESFAAAAETEVIQPRYGRMADSSLYARKNDRGNAENCKMQCASTHYKAIEKMRDSVIFGKRIAGKDSLFV